MIKSTVLKTSKKEYTYFFTSDNLSNINQKYKKEMESMTDIQKMIEEELGLVIK